MANKNGDRVKFIILVGANIIFNNGKANNWA